MNTKRMLAAVMCVVAVVAAAAPRPHASQSGQSPETLRIHVDHFEGPQPGATLPERIQQVDAVVRCKVTDVNVRVKFDPNRPQSVPPKYGIDLTSVYRVDVLEIVKDHQRLSGVGFSMSVTQEVGEADIDGIHYVKGTDEVIPVEVGDEYVLFLQWRSGAGFTIPHGADAVRLDQSGTVASVAHSRYVASGSGTQEFLVRLRSAAR